jgi:hypothetical protein
VAWEIQIGIRAPEGYSSDADAQSTGVRTKRNGYNENGQRTLGGGLPDERGCSEEVLDSFKTVNAQLCVDAGYILHSDAPERGHTAWLERTQTEELGYGCGFLHHQP